MFACIERGMRADGVLPGGLKVQRRARQVLQNLMCDADQRDPPTRWRRWTGSTSGRWR